MFDLRKWMIDRGYPTISTEMSSSIVKWLAWYKGYVKDFHDYPIYNGIRRVDMKRRSLEMAKFVCEDWANLLLNERVQINVDESFSDRLEELLHKSRWYLKANQDVELAFALGTSAFVEYRDADGTPRIDHYRADMIHPISWGPEGVTECAFASVCTVEKRQAVYVMLHLLDGGKYRIENHMFDYQSGQEIELNGMLPNIPTDSTTPLFQIIRPNIINSVDLDSPMGMSVYGNSMDLLASLDEVFDSLDNEFRLGRKRILLPLSMAKIRMDGATGTDGKPVMTPAFDHKDTVFYAYETNDATAKPIELNMDLRIEEHEKGLLTNLALLGKKVGVGTDRYAWDKASGVKTATEVISDKSDLYQNMRKHELELETAIIGMVQALAFLDTGRYLDEVKVNFDDSIIQDSQAELDNAIAKLNNGLIAHKTVMTDVFDMTEEDADAELELIREEQTVQMPAVDSSLAGNDNPFGNDGGEEEDEDDDE